MTGMDRRVNVPDAVMQRVGEGIALREQGDRAAARRLFAELWDEIGGDSGDAFYRCALAHSMADVQDDVEQELLWDLRALVAADLITDERAAQGGVIGPVSVFYPSLHLNLGECYRKLGDTRHAREQLRKGLSAAQSLPDDGYSRMIKGGLTRLAGRLSSE